MPIYEFLCPACSAQFEDLVPPGGSTPCPVCNRANPQRRISTFSAPRGVLEPTAQATNETNDRPVVPVGMEDATLIERCELNGAAHGIYAPNGGKGIIRQSKIRGGISAIEAGGDARFHLEDTDVEEP